MNPRSSKTDKPTIRRISSQLVYENPWMVLREDEIERPDGSQGIYAYVDKPDFSLIIPVERDGFHLVEQYRYPTSRRSWEFPQGSFPNRADGDPAELARQELAQETGLRARRLDQIGYLHTAVGMSSQAYTVFVADDLATGEHTREPEEQDMIQRWISRADFESMLRHGEITDDSTLAAYTLFILHERASARSDGG